MNPEKGYNKREGGSGGKMSKETRKKMSNNRKGIKFSEEHLRNMSLCKLGKRTGKDNNKSISVVCLETKEIFESITQAIKIMHLPPHCGIFKIVSQTGQKTAGGYHWLKYDDFINKTEEEINQIISIKQFAQPNLRKKVINILTGSIYISNIEASLDNNCTPSCVTNHCKNKVLKENQKFMYYEDWLKQQKDES